MLWLVVAACSPGTVPGSPPGPPPSGVALTVFGAASLADVLDRIRPAYEAAHPGVRLTIATDSSATLRVQIEQGAPADVFLAADTVNPGRLVDAGLTAGPALRFASNRLAIVTPTDDPARVAGPFDLARPGLRIIAAGDGVPITAYASTAVARLAALPGAPAGFAEAYARNVVSREDNVQAVVTRIELGEGDAAIVYATDARSADVRTIDLPPEADVRAAYAGVVTAASARPADARAFLAWLSGPSGQAILGSFGFAAP